MNIIEVKNLTKKFKIVRLIFKNQKDTPINLLRRAGYGFLGNDGRTGEGSFVKRLSGADYPRFHVYAKKEGDDLIVSLHLDQKKASYGNQTAHSGEYQDSETLQREAEYIKRALGA